jgi:iron complex outermembrane receptor protein
MLGVDYRWVDERYLEATNQPFDKVDDYWLANVRASVKSPDGRWDLALYCTNVFDEEYITYINNIAFFQLEILGEPRTFGGIISYNFR